MSVWEKIRNWFIMDPPDGEEPIEEGISDEIIDDGYDSGFGIDDEPERRGWFGFGLIFSRLTSEITVLLPDSAAALPMSDERPFPNPPLLATFNHFLSEVTVCLCTFAR